MSQLYVAVLAVIVIVLLSVAVNRTSRVKTKADYPAGGPLPSGRGSSAYSAHFVDRRRLSVRGGGECLQEWLLLPSGSRLAAG